MFFPLAYACLVQSDRSRASPRLDDGDHRFLAAVLIIGTCQDTCASTSRQDNFILSRSIKDIQRVTVY